MAGSDGNPGGVAARTAADAGGDADLALRMYRQMWRIRVFEGHANELYLTGKMPGLTHLYSGQEAVAVGVCEALERTDYITSTHRGHGHCVAKGARLDLMFAELLGRAPGYCRGKGGSMHIADQENGNLGANAIVGGSAGIATGAALSSLKRGSGQVAVCFFGEGALGQGLLYEVMNIARLWRLPVVYVCENNQYNEYTHFLETTAGEVLDRARAFGIRAEAVDGQDVRAVHRIAGELVGAARAGEGPAFLECATYRYHGHHVGDIAREYYRPKSEEAEWRERRDPIKLLGDALVAEGVATPEELAGVEAEVRAEAAAAVEFALAAPFPDPTEVTLHVYA